ncbi:MAG: hypothetical protein FK732_04700 [Asgard group archaeon]|nr:hypothetical protein [Asgard group archaeon]
MMKSSNNTGFQPIFTFVSIIILGIILAQYVLTAWKVQIILLSIFLGGLIAALELRNIARSSRKKVKRKNKISDEEAKEKLARYVADIFDDDIPFKEENKKSKSERN